MRLDLISGVNLESILRPVYQASFKNYSGTPYTKYRLRSEDV